MIINPFNIKIEIPEKVFSLMSSCKEKAYEIARNMDINSEEAKSLLDDAVYYQDKMLVDIALTKGISIQSLCDNSLLIKVLNSPLNGTAPGNFFKSYDISYHLNYNIDFIEMLLDKGMTIKENNSFEVLIEIIKQLSDVMEYESADKINTDNIIKFNNILKWLNKNGLNITSKKIFEYMPYLVGEFKHIRQWEIFNPFVKDGILLEKDRDNNNLLHYFFFYINKHSTLLDKKNQKSNNNIIINTNQLNGHMLLMGASGTGKSNYIRNYINSMGINQKTITINVLDDILDGGNNSIWTMRGDLNSNNLYETLNKWTNIMYKYSDFYKIIDEKNNNGHCPRDLAKNEVALTIKRKIDHDFLKNKLYSKATKRTIHKI